MSGRRKGRPVRGPRHWAEHRVPVKVLDDLREEVHVDLMMLPLWRRLYACWEILLGPRRVRKARREGWRLSRLTDLVEE